MTQRRAYLDYNAGAPVRGEVAEAVARALRIPGNPSSVHAEGRTARAALDAARGEIAAFAGGNPRNLIAVSGGAEAAATLLHPGLRRDGDRRDQAHLLVAAGEHACVLHGHRFRDDDVTILPLDTSGRLDLSALDAALADLAARAPDARLLLAVQAANNETGVIQPVAEAAARVHAQGGLLVCDAVQAAGRLPVDLASLGADALFLSAHKIGGPKGVGAIILAEGVVLDPAARLLRGGGQEGNRRAGTQNLPGMVGFGVAAALARRELATEPARLMALRDELETALTATGVRVAGADVPRLPNTSLLLRAGVTAQTALMALDLQGFAVSTGAACSSGKVTRSHVLTAMGLPPDLADSAVRVSLGHAISRDDVIRFVAAYEDMASAATRSRPAA